jgi:hypothetical protein
VVGTTTLSFYAIAGFMLAAYSVIANDSVQTLGTFIASNSTKFKWYVLAACASGVLCLTLGYGWAVNGGDIAFRRLSAIPFQEIQWYHSAAPAVLLLLTRVGIPVSTTFLVLSAFASTVVLERMLIKSIVGYGLAAVSAYALWLVLSRFINEKLDRPTHPRAWRTAQWLTTGFLWYTWLAHDIANVAVFLPRKLPAGMLVVVLATCTALLFWIFRNRGGAIQKVVLTKTGTRYVRSAAIIDFVYALLLVGLKQHSEIPMSTTWVFVGLLCGRELAIATMSGERKLGHVFPIIGSDFLKMSAGLSVSVAIVLTIHYVLMPSKG